MKGVRLTQEMHWWQVQGMVTDTAFCILEYLGSENKNDSYIPTGIAVWSQAWMEQNPCLSHEFPVLLEYNLRLAYKYSRPFFFKQKYLTLHFHLWICIYMLQSISFSGEDKITTHKNYEWFNTI